MKITLPHNWTPRNYQMPVWKHYQGAEPGKRGVCVWHRRAGKDLLALNLCATKLFERVGVYWHLLPTYRQGRAIVWNGFTREGRPFLDHFPKELITGIHGNEMRIHFTNKSIYQVVGTDDINTLVGTNPVGCVFSEYSLHDPAAWQYIRPILAENGGWALFIFTFRGKNHGWKLWREATKAGWFVDMRTAGSGEEATKREDGTPVISDAQIEDDRKSGMPEELIQQEYFNNAEAALVGAYYSQNMDLMKAEGRICTVPYDEKLPVHTAWDIGVGDQTFIIFFQLYGLEIRIIDCYHNSGEGLPHYAKVLKERPYVYEHHYGPWDIAVREFSSGKSRVETARGLGIKFRITPQHAIEDGIEQVRNIMRRIWIDGGKCEILIEALRSYRKQPESEAKQYTGMGRGMQVFKDGPVHDWSSHGADACRTLAWNIRKGHKYGQQDKDAPQLTAKDEFSYV